MDIKDLTPEQMEKAKACKTPEEMLALAKEEGYELSEDELNAISGGVSEWSAGRIKRNEGCLNDSCKSLYCEGFGCSPLSCPDYTCMEVMN